MGEIVLNAPGGGWTQACRVDALLNGVVHLVCSDVRYVRDLAQMHDGGRVDNRPNGL